MTLEIIDSISLPGNPAKANEDAFGAEERAAVVMDGATGLGDNLMPGPSDAAWLATFGARRLLAHLRDGDAPKHAVRAAMKDAEQSYKALRKRAPAENYEIPHASMMLVAQADDGIDALWFGDCALLVQVPGGGTEVIGDALDKRATEASRVARLAAKHGLSPAAGINRPVFLEALRKARNYANTEKGHWSFAPEPHAAEHVECTRRVLPAETVLLLCSDGFLALVSDYKAYDAAGLIAACQTKGLAAIAEELRAIESADADGVKFPRFKTSDDATALLLKLR
jgi:serine/threonine protein phosphatase PrpC